MVVAPPDPAGRVWRWLRRRPAAVRDSTRARAIRALWSLGAGWVLGVGLLVGVGGLLPNAAIVAMGSAVGRIPAAARAGLHGPAATHLVLALALAVVLYALSLLSGPFQEML